MKEGVARLVVRLVQIVNRFLVTELLPNMAQLRWWSPTRLLLIWAAGMLVLMSLLLLLISLFFVMLYLGLLMLLIFVLARLSHLESIKAPDVREGKQRAASESW